MTNKSDQDFINQLLKELETERARTTLFVEVLTKIRVEGTTSGQSTAIRLGAMARDAIRLAYPED